MALIKLTAVSAPPRGIIIKRQAPLCRATRASCLANRHAPRMEKTGACQTARQCRGTMTGARASRLSNCERSSRTFEGPDLPGSLSRCQTITSMPAATR